MFNGFSTRKLTNGYFQDAWKQQQQQPTRLKEHIFLSRCSVHASITKKLAIEAARYEEQDEN